MLHLMKNRRFPNVKVIFGLLSVLILGACAQKVADPTLGDFSGRDTISVLVIADDEDGASFPRSSQIHQQIVSRAQDQLHRQGFIVKDGDFLAVDAGFSMRDRMSKSDLVEAVKLINAQNRASSRADYFVLIRSFARQKSSSFSNQLSTYLEGEIYRVRDNRFMSSFYTPTRKLASPSDCDFSCARDLVSRDSALLADDFGAALAKELANITGQRNISKDKVGPSLKGLSADTYVFSLNGFHTEEALEIMRVMSKEFPGYKSHNLISRNNQSWTYEYASKANLGKLEKWVNILLLDMGYNPDSDVDIRFNNRHFRLTLRGAENAGSYSGTTGFSRGSGRFK